MWQNFLLTFISVDGICSMIAKMIAKLLSYASKRGGSAWDKTKQIILQTNVWTSLYLQVYDDETLTKEEEKIIADAIKNKTPVSKIMELLKK